MIAAGSQFTCLDICIDFGALIHVLLFELGRLELDWDVDHFGNCKLQLLTPFGMIRVALQLKRRHQTRYNKQGICSACGKQAEGILCHVPAVREGIQVVSGHCDLGRETGVDDLLFPVGWLLLPGAIACACKGLSFSNRTLLAG
jgi:hypothetical protein